MSIGKSLSANAKSATASSAQARTGRAGVPLVCPVCSYFASVNHTAATAPFSNMADSLQFLIHFVHGAKRDGKSPL